MTVDTSTAAITDRCQHLDHCAHDGKSEDAARMMALLSERNEWMSAFGHFLSEIPLQDVLGASGSVQDAIDYFKAAIAERDALRDQLAAARNEALEEVRRKIAGLSLGNPEGEIGDEILRIAVMEIEDLKSTTPATRCDVCGDSGSVSTFDIDQNGEHIEIACPECTASAPHQIDRVSLADIEGYGTNSTPAPRETFQSQVKPWEFDAPYALTRTETLGKVWYQLSAHGVGIASFLVESWGSEQACIEAAWHHAYDTAPREVTVQEAYLAGFMAAGEGYNGEYPFQDKDASPEDCDMWVNQRDEDLRALAQEGQSDV